MLSIINDIKGNLESGQTSRFLEGLQQFSDINKVEYEANKGEFQFEFKQMIDSIDRGFNLIKHKVDSPLNLEHYFRKIMKAVPNTFEKNYASTLERINRSAKKAAVENIATMFKNEVVENLEREIISDAIHESDVINVNLKAPTSSVVTDTPIEESVKPFEQILSQKIGYVSPNNIPNSVKFLASYAETQNKVPIGSITDYKGSAYVGLESVDRGDMTALVPMQQQFTYRPRVPNIASEINYHAIKTINSWNNFVRDESELVDFVDKISSKEKRLKYVEDQFKGINFMTFNAEVLATLTFYYVMIPLEKYIRKMRVESLVTTQAGFFEQYQVGATLKENPLLISTNVGKAIALELFGINEKLEPIKEERTPTEIVKKIGDILTKSTNELNKKAISKLLKHTEMRWLESESFFRVNGIDKNYQVELLAIKDFSSVKKRRFVFPESSTNSQFVNIVQKLMSKKESQKVSVWNLQWGNEEMYCYDYVWRNE